MAGQGNYYNGALLLNKPVGLSSHEAVVNIRRTTGQRRVGHTGTLDPLAEGLMVICLGKATKIAQFISAFNKTYEAEICFGQSSATFDSEGIYNDELTIPVPDLKEDKLDQLLSKYKGITTQKVPAYSAVKIGGQRLYRLARSGVIVDTPEREIEILEIKVLSYYKPFLSIRITCSPGTYIRSLANDLGEGLGCGAYLSGLRRIAVGDLCIEQALELDDIKRYHETGALDEHLLRYEDVIPFSAVTISDNFIEGVLSGKMLTSHNVVKLQGSFSSGERILLKDSNGHVLAIGTADVPSDMFTNGRGQKLFTYIRVLN